jgi:hypothetical protein
MDVLTITGIGRRLDGDYDCDIAALIDISSDEALTNREAHLIKTLSGARGGEIVEAFLAGDMAVRMALAIVVLQRAGRRVDPEQMWDQKAGWAKYTFGADAEEDETPADPPEATGTWTPANGGSSSASPSDSRDDDRSRIGSPA